TPRRAWPMSLIPGADVDATNLVALFLAGGALLVALTGLSLSNLKRANIDVIRLTGRHRVSASGTVVGGAGDKMLSDSAMLVLSLVALVAFNAGARAGVLVSVRVDEIQELAEHPRLFE